MAHGKPRPLNDFTITRQNVGPIGRRRPKRTVLTRRELGLSPKPQSIFGNACHPPENTAAKSLKTPPNAPENCLSKTEALERPANCGPFSCSR